MQGLWDWGSTFLTCAVLLNTHKKYTDNDIKRHKRDKWAICQVSLKHRSDPKWDPRLSHWSNTVGIPGPVHAKLSFNTQLYKKTADKHRPPASGHTVGQRVWLSIQDLPLRLKLPRSMSLSCLPLGKRWGTPWTDQQSITRSTQRQTEKQSRTVTLCQVRWCKEGRTQMQNFSKMKKGLFPNTKGHEAKNRDQILCRISKRLELWTNKRLWKNKTRLGKTRLWFTNNQT